MHMTAQDAFSEIRDGLYAPLLEMEERYRRLYALLHEVCIEASAGLSADYSGLFSRLYAVCRSRGIDHHAADRFRRNARLVVMGRNSQPLTQEKLHADTALLCAFVAQIYNTAVPADLPQNGGAATLKASAIGGKRVERLRAVVTAVYAEHFTCTSELGDFEVSVPHLRRTMAVLHEGHAVNLIDFSATSDTAATARLVVIDPDYTVDVSALTAALKDHGDSAANYILSLLEPRRTTAAILLGEAANQFMDTLVNTSADLSSATALDRLYSQALRQHFSDHMLSYVCLPETIDRAYFDRLRQTFDNIARTVRDEFPTSEVGLPPGDILLEPSFICEALGLRGRFDVLRADNRCLVELKSGRAEDFNVRHIRPRTAHVLQMSLYKEMLHYCCGMPRDAVRSFLFYSRYPLLFDERSSAQAVSDVLELRNEIVVLEERLRRGDCESVLPLLSPEQLNTNGLQGRFWENYLRPAIEQVSLPLQQADALTRTYFNHFLSFVEGEKYLSKTTDMRPDSNRGQATAWTADVQTKLQSGDILIGLRLLAVEGDGGAEFLELALPDDRSEDFVPNFTPGEMVQLYERRDAADSVTTRRLTRGYIEELTANTLRLRLAFKQSGADKLFSFSTTYAVEHDGSDMPSRLALRGLFSLLTAEPARRDLLLGRKRPGVNKAPRPLSGTYPEDVAAVVAGAYAAEDYYLLVGPPGTGKTSVTLRALVAEFLLRHAENTAPEEKKEGLMLMAYTNRAVDEICEMLLQLRAPFIRIGSEQVCSEASHPHLLRNALADCKNRAEATTRLLATPIIVGTVTTLSSRTEIFRLRPFMAVVDEASQVLEPQLMGLLCARRDDGTSGLRRFILVGDHRQLPAVVLLPPSRTRVSDPELQAIGLTDLRNSLFQRLHTLCRERGWEGVTAMLHRTGRMHEDICRFAARTFYADQLTTVPLPHQTAPLENAPSEGAYENFVATNRMGFIDVRPTTPPPSPRANMDEAEAMAQLVAALIRHYAAIGRPLDVARQVGIIVPFRAQIAQTRRALRRNGIAEAERITVDTVECYQGSQRDIIIFSTVISRPRQLNLLSEEQIVEGQAIDRKLNVALTRARLRFFLVGNAALLSARPVYAQLIAAGSTLQASP